MVDNGAGAGRLHEIGGVEAFYEIERRSISCCAVSRYPKPGLERVTDTCDTSGLNTRGKRISSSVTQGGK